MLTETCRAFRAEFERGRTDPHRESCASCRSWAAAVEGLAGFGLNLALPPGLESRLREAGPGSRPKTAPETEAPEASPLEAVPQLPLPEDLRGRLRLIPAGVRANPYRLWVGRTRDTVAASCLLALALAVGPAGRITLRPERAGVLVQGARLIAIDAESRGLRAVARAGNAIVEGCAIANDALGSLVQRVRMPLSKRPDSNTPQTAAGRTGPPEGKEKPHGNRPTH